jgi:hypothetical protein
VEGLDKRTADFFVAVDEFLKSNKARLQALFDSAHNPVFRLGISGDAAMALLAFWRRVNPDTGTLVHDFTDPAWGTRFLGDLYQDLSESTRKRYALLQTPDFIESFILYRTLTPAIAEFGYREVRLIDPTCGSGHFLLGAFARLLDLWSRNEPARPRRKRTGGGARGFRAASASSCP